MKHQNYAKWAVFLSIGILGCLDLNLRDEMKVMDTDTVDAYAYDSPMPTDEEGRIAPKKDASDTDPPQLVSISCEAPARAEGDGCVSEGPVSVLIEFVTNEAASLQGETGTAIVSDSWETRHLVLVPFSEGDDGNVALKISDVNDNTENTMFHMTRSNHPGVVISEIQADPIGAEPAQEYIELYNQSENAVDLSSWMIDDNGDRDGDFLPEGTVLGPNKVALIISDAYDISSVSDPAPDAAAQLIRISGSIVSNGLKNSEPESVELYDEAGNLVSRYNGNVPLGDSGESVHRQNALWPPLAENAFGEIKPASPGWL